MRCRLEDLRQKEVISLKDGRRLGWVGDGEIDTEKAALTALVIYGRWRLFGLLGKEKDLVIPWDCIRLIGEETVLAQLPEEPQPPRGEEGFLRKVLKKWDF